MGEPSDISAQLERLVRLRAANEISDQEFQLLKSKALAGATVSTDLGPTQPAQQRPSPVKVEGGLGKFTVGIVVTLLLGLAAGFPMLNEDRGSECAALESYFTRVVVPQQSAWAGDRAARVNIFAALMAGISDGEVGEQIAKKQYPWAPAFFGCTVSYYQLYYKFPEIKVDPPKG